MSDEFTDSADWEGDFYDDGSAGDANELPPEHWVNNPEAVAWANAMVETVMNDPKALEEWWVEFAKQNELRGLVDPIAERKLRLDDPEVQEQAKAALQHIWKRPED